MPTIANVDARDFSDLACWLIVQIGPISLNVTTPFTDLLLKMETDDPVIRSLQFAVLEQRRGAFSISEALRYSRQNPRREGTQDMNYRYHIRYLPPHAVPHIIRP